MRLSSWVISRACVRFMSESERKIAVSNLNIQSTMVIPERQPITRPLIQYQNSRFSSGIISSPICGGLQIMTMYAYQKACIANARAQQANGKTTTQSDCGTDGSHTRRSAFGNDIKLIDIHRREILIHENTINKLVQGMQRIRIRHAYRSAKNPSSELYARYAHKIELYECIVMQHMDAIAQIEQRISNADIGRDTAISIKTSHRVHWAC